MGHVTALRLGFDALAVATSLFVATAARSSVPEKTDASADHLRLGLAFLPVWIAVLAVHGLYREARLGRRPEEMRALTRSVGVSIGGLAVLAIALGRTVNGAWLPLWAASALVLLFAERELLRRGVRRLRRHGQLCERIVVVGGNAEAAGLVEAIGVRSDLGMTVVAVVADDAAVGTQIGGMPVVGRVQSMLDVVGHFGATGVMVVASAMKSPAWNHVAFEAADAGLRLELAFGVRDTAPERISLKPVGRSLVGRVGGNRLRGWRKVAKRLLDVAVSAVGLVLAAPVLIIATVAIRLDSPGGVLFRQERLGQHGRPFRILKLRTMVDNAEALRPALQAQNEADGPLFKMVTDPRVTRVGRVLRKLSLDELPQLWNVLRGDMSLVGPRPALPSERAEWDKSLFPRLRVKPGITGLWQVAGRSNSSFEEYARLDLYYVRNWSFSTDLAILARTVPAVLFRRGAF